MSKQRDEIIEYYSNIINEFDISCEKAILFFKTEDVVNEIQANREKIISKIKQTELSKLENFKDSETLYDGTFAFFISNDQSKDHASDEKLDLNNNAPFSWTMSQKRGEKFEFVKHLGQLVVASSLEENIVKKLINCRLNIKFKSYILEESTKFQVYDQLIKSKNDQVIIDLSQKEKNQIDGLELRSYLRDEIPMTESGFELIPTYLDVESVRELKIVGYSDMEFPTQIFRPFKNLTRLKIKNLIFLKSLNKNSFIGLESLEILELAKSFIDIEENAFKALINLKMLIFTKCYFGNFHKKSGLENLKALKIKDCTLADFRLEFLELFKSLENLQIFTSRFAKSEIKSFNRFEKLKILETDLEEKIHFKSNLEIYSLASQSFKPHISLNELKFLIIRDEFQFTEINFLNQLNQLEFLDLKLSKKLADNFNQINLPKLKHLVLTCKNTPNFNQSLQNLQGLELIDSKFTPGDKFINLKSLDYLAITNAARSMFDTFCGTTFSTIKNLKFLKIENCYNEFSYDEDKKNKINEKLSKLFESPENVFYGNMCDNECLFELSAKLGEEQITEKVYFEKYLKVSDCIREFVLNKDSNYYKEYLRNTKRRQSNFGLDEESNSEMESCEGEVDYYMSYEEFLNSYHEHDEYGYNIDDRYMMDYEYTIINDDGEYDYDYGQL